MEKHRVGIEKMFSIEWLLDYLYRPSNNAYSGIHMEIWVPHF